MLSQAVKRGKQEGFDVVLCDTSGRKCYELSSFGLADFSLPLSWYSVGVLY